jgi:hypothetical protein
MTPRLGDLKQHLTSTLSALQVPPHSGYSQYPGGETPLSMTSGGQSRTLRIWCIVSPWSLFGFLDEAGSSNLRAFLGLS